MTKLATKVVKLREVKGLSQSSLAQLVPIQKSYLSRIEKGIGYNIGRKILRGLASALDISIDYLDDDDMDENNRSWVKVATDESLAIFFKQVNLPEEERARLRRISFTETAPRSLKEWHQLWNNLTIYNQTTSEKRYRSGTRTRRKANTEDS